MLTRSRSFRSRARTLFSLVEMLESRVLLSGVAAHDFVILQNTARRAAINAPNGLSPAIVRQAYGINQVLFGSVVGDGTGQTIAIVDAYNAPSIVSDLHAFDVMFGLPDPVLTRINQSGGTTMPGNDPSGRGNSWAVETSLDVEWAHAVAPKANIVLVLANSASNANLMAAVNTARRYAGVSAVSMSWGGDESSSDPTFNSTFTTPAGHNGVTFLAASGDSGAYGFNGTSITVGYPAASPNVLAVGGTSLNTDAAGNYISESGWGSGSASGNNGGSGGGISRYEAQPTYQRGVVTQTTTFRALPDVAFLADPNTGVAVVDSYDFGNTSPVPIGGTSLATPMWAGVIALTNQGRALAGLGTLDGVSQTLPKLYALPSTDFHDITTGNNGYAAGPGFDLVTGRGTPIVNRLVADLASATGPAPAPATPSIGALTVNPSSVVSGTSITITASNVTETGGTVSNVLFYRESNGQAGLQTGLDTLIGSGIRSGTTWALTTTTAALGGGSYSYYAVATDTANVSSAVVAAGLTIVTPKIGGFGASPGAVNAGTSVTLTASNVTESGGTVSGVAFYRESNGQAGMQGTDTLVGSGTQSGTNWSLAAATTGLSPGGYTYYAVATDAAGVTASASVTLTITSPTAPPTPPSTVVTSQGNDNFAAGTLLTGATVTANGSNVGATVESGEPYHAGNIGGHSVWYTWTAPASGVVNLNTHGSNFDTLLAVYTGKAVNTLATVASNDDDPTMNTLTSQVAFKVVAGTTYHIAVDGFNGDMGNLTLNLAMAAAPANDNFANAAVFTGSWTGSTIGATRETGEPSLAGNTGGSSVWLTWTPTATRTVTLRTAGSNFDTLLGVYTGNSVNALSLVAGNDDVSYFDRSSTVTFTAIAGTTYHIRIDGYKGAQGTAALNVV